MDKRSESIEDYLEAMVMLGATTEHSVRCVDVAVKLDVSKASVSKAVSNLKNMGFVTQEHYGTICLTQEGLEYGESVLERHELLIGFLTKQLGIPQERAEEEACKMEHAISDESFESWRAYIKKVNNE